MGQTLKRIRQHNIQNDHIISKPPESRFDRSRSQGSEAKSMVRKGEMPDDAGLFPGTLIMPKWRVLLQAHKMTYMKFVVMQSQRVVKRAKDYGSLLLAWRYQLAYPKLRKRNRGAHLPLKWRSMKNSALAMYIDMNSSLYGNDVERLREICCNSTAKEQVRRAMNQRSRGLAYEWNLIKLLSPVEVISHRATPQSLEDGSDFPVLYRQAIVRVHALQTLVPRNRKGLSDALVGNSETHAIDEYMVLQKRLYQGIEEDWKVWGTLQGGVDETKLEDWEETLNPDPTAGSRDAQRQPDLPPSGSGPAPAV